MSVSILDPTTDPRWAEFMERHPRASVFHSPGWLQALRLTHGWEPFALTTSPAGGTLANGMPVCRVRTWVSDRLVSLPFSDHCEPLAEHPEDLSEMLSFLASEVGTAGRRSVEVRPRQRETAGDSRSAWPSDEPVPFGASGGPGFSPGAQYVLHSLDLTPPLDQIHARFHPSCVRRPIRRAEREGVTCESGRSGELLAAFYPLVTMARRRHGLPPPPRAWFENLLRCLEDRVTIHVARKAGVAVAGILMLTHRRTVTYKAGGSDGRFHSLGVMPFLFWHAIRDAKQRGIEEMDLGRSDLDQPGLIAFKDHFGARRSTVTYYHYPPGQARVAQDDWKVRAARRVFARLPLPALSLAGRLLYKQFG